MTHVHAHAWSHGSVLFVDLMQDLYCCPPKLGLRWELFFFPLSLWEGWIQHTRWSYLERERKKSHLWQDNAHIRAISNLVRVGTPQQDMACTKA